MSAHQCLISGSEVKPFISFGQMPIANGFLRPEEYSKEKFFELAVGYCPESKMVQLLTLVEPSEMFHENYAFFSSTSAGMSKHFEKFAHDVMARLKDQSDPFVVELGCNDGIMLRHFASKGIRHLGVEPSENVAKAANQQGVKTVSKFFGEELAQEIKLNNGQADAILGANVMCHIPDLNSVVRGFKQLLKPSGLVIFEDPYLGDIIEKTSYDQIYDEHAFYFSLASIQYLFQKHGMEVVDVIPQSVHGGSMRYLIGHAGAHKPSAEVQRLREKEEKLELTSFSTFEKFRKNVEESREKLMTLLKKLKIENKRVVGYGATSKSTTVTNYCGITPELVEFISDTTPIKQGKYSPGAHIPIKPYHDFSVKYPDYALLFAWNHAEEIKNKEKSFESQGGKWIVYVPEVKVL